MAPPKRRRGRPRGLKLPFVVRFRINEDDRDYVQCAAECSGISMSAWFRLLLAKHREETPLDDP